MKRILLGLLLAFLVLALFVSCGKRDNPLRSRYLFRDPWMMSAVEFPALEGSIVSDPYIRNVYAYLPPNYDLVLHQPQLINEGFSVLYLLHDFGVDAESFVNVYKVLQIADQLIAEEKIQPMIIVMPDASSIFSGGSFYTNSRLLGDYEDYVAREVTAKTDSNLHTYGVKPQELWIPDPRYRAISGLGMGGYGALKIAMDYDSLFASVSAMSPYTSFGSFLNEETIERVFEENGIAPGDISLASYKTLNPWTDEQHPDKTYSQLIFAMAAAFTPRMPTDPVTDTYIQLATIGGQPHGVYLPFDSTRAVPPGSPVWSKWFLHDLATKLTNDPGTFGDLEMYLDCGDQDELELYHGVRAFSQLLSLYGKDHTYIEYSGYPSYPAGHDSFIYDRLVEILKFHSDHFPPPAYRE